MYGPFQLYMNRAALNVSTNLSTRDDWVENVRNLLAAAGWITRVVGGRATLAYQLSQGDALSYKVFGPLNPDGGDNVFWRVTNAINGQFTHVIDFPKSNGTTPNGTFPAIQTGSNTPSATIQGIIQAIALLGAGGATYTVDIFINATTVRMKTNSARNSDTGQYNIGASLNSTFGAQRVHAGYVCESQASIRKALKNGAITTFGDKNLLSLAGNYLSLYFTSSADSNAPEQVFCACAQKFLDYPLDNQIIASGATSVNRLGRTNVGSTSYGGRLGAMDLWRTIAFANPYQLVLHGEDANGVVQNWLCCSALKLIDTRLGDTSIDLWVKESTFFACGSSGDTGLRSQSFVGGSTMRQAINGQALYGASALASGVPQLLLYGVSSGNENSVDRLLWSDGIGGWAPDCEPWVMYSVTAYANQGPVVGQMWDAMSIYETTSDPNTALVFPWDGVNWRRYTKNAKQLPSGLKLPHTLCLRMTSEF